MLFRMTWRARLWALLAGAGMLTTATSSGLGQEVALGLRPRSCPTTPCPSCTTPAPAPAPQAIPPEKAPEVQPPVPAPAAEPAFTPEQFAATGGGESFAAASSAVGYIDPAIPVTRFRLRADAAYNNNRPDRAEFFYPKCGCFALAGIDPAASGPPKTETSVDYQEINSYLEWAPIQRLSAFVELPVRFVNPEVNDNTAGLGDINAGFKYAFLYCPQQVATFQFRVYTPSGDGDKGLGTNHVSLEPALLYYRQLTNRMAMEAEFRDWAAAGGSDFAGNIIRYGIGANYQVVNRQTFRVAPVVEFVGWTVLHGKEFDFPEGAVQDAAGDTIINGKVGVRSGFGPLTETGMNRADLYLGYGRALTGEVWYKDVMRLEFRLNF